MQEVKNAATGLKAFVESIKKVTAAAHEAFATEGKMAIDNAGKLMSATADLKDANKMMEEALGATGSNFPNLEEHLEGSSKHTDSNGVTLNTEVKK